MQREDPGIARDSHGDASHRAAASSRPLRRYRPAGHVVGHAFDDPAPPPRGNRPVGHVVGNATRGSSHRSNGDVSEIEWSTR
jgi:hypothetical protein